MNYPYYQPAQPVAQTPYYRPPQYMAEQPQPQIKGRPVSSIDEVRATSIDFDGSIFYFPDLANKKIYTKQINLDGTSTLNIYELKNIPVEPSLTQYVTREEFEATLGQIKQAIMQQQQIAEPAPTASTPAPDNDIAKKF